MVNKVRQGIIAYEPSSVFEENVDFASIDKFGLSPETLTDYCHTIIDEEINRVCENNKNSYTFKKSDVKTFTEDIDLSSFKPQSELCPEIWDENQEMDSEIRLQLMEIADDFIKTFKMDWAKPTDVILTGSLANYNWSKYSDFDLHILMDFHDVDERVEFVKDYFDSKKKEWNNLHYDITIHKYPVEVYVQDVNEDHTASGVYSIWKNKWLVKPEKDKIKSLKLEKPMIRKKCNKYISIIDKLIKKYKFEKDKHKLEELGKDVQFVFDKIKEGRREGLKKSGEMSPYNIIFKAMRRFGYIEKLISIKNDIYNRLHSIK